MAEKSLEEEIEEAMRMVDGSGPQEPAEPPPPPTAPPEPQLPPEPMDEALPALEEAGAPEGMALPAVIEPEEPDAAPVAASRTLAVLDESRRPKPEIACGMCPNSVWFATPTDLTCYCRVMFMQTWTAQKPGEIVSCDGMFLGQE